MALERNLKQMFDDNPTTSIPGTALLYLVLAPFGPTTDSGIAWTNVLASIAAQLTELGVMVDIQFDDGGTINAGQGAANTLKLNAYDVDDEIPKTFITFTSGNTPTCDLDGDVTIAGSVIVRAGANINISSMSGLSGDLGNSIQAIRHSPNPAINNTVTGLVSQNVAGENVSFGNLLYVKTSDQKLYKADNTDSTKFPAVYMAAETVTANNTVKYLELGKAASVSYALTPGLPLYLSTSGTFTQTAPSAGKTQIIGMADSATVVSFDCQQSPASQPVNPQTGTTYILTAFDNGRPLTLNNVAAVTLTLPQQSTTPTPPGFSVPVQNLGAGTVTVVKEGAETLTGNTTLLQGASAILQRTSSTNWNVFGGSSIVNMFGASTLIQTLTTSETYVLTYQVGTSCTLLGVGQQCRALTTAGSFAIHKNGVALSGLGTIVPSTGGSYTSATGTGADNLLVRGDKITIVANGTLVAVLGLSVLLDFTQPF